MKYLALFALLCVAAGNAHFTRLHHIHPGSEVATSTPAGDTISGLNGI